MSGAICLCREACDALVYSHKDDCYFASVTCFMVGSAKTLRLRSGCVIYCLSSRGQGNKAAGRVPLEREYRQLCLEHSGQFCRVIGSKAVTCFTGAMLDT